MINTISLTAAAASKTNNHNNNNDGEILIAADQWFTVEVTNTNLLAWQRLMCKKLVNQTRELERLRLNVLFFYVFHFFWRLCGSIYIILSNMIFHLFRRTSYKPRWSRMKNVKYSVLDYNVLLNYTTLQSSTVLITYLANKK